MVSSLYIVIASMVIMSSIVSGHTKLTDAILTNKQNNLQNMDYDIMTGNQLPLHNTMYPHKQQNTWQNAQNVDDFNELYENIYELAYTLIIWGCIGLLTLSNMIIAIIETIRLANALKAYSFNYYFNLSIIILIIY